jgi:hypothetical protein
MTSVLSDSITLPGSPPCHQTGQVTICHMSLKPLFPVKSVVLKLKIFAVYSFVQFFLVHHIAKMN